MTREAIEYFKFYRKIFCEDYLKICPKDSIAYQATLKEKEFYDIAIKALEQEPRKRTMQLVIDNKKQKEFAHEITKKFSFEELALFMYENSCEYCQKQHNCMGNVTPQDCAKNIRQKFEKAYFETGDKEWKK